MNVLSQEPCQVKNELNVKLNELKLCTDAMSRQAVLDNLCNSCTNIGCMFQSGIIRTKCAFYIPPHVEGYTAESTVLNGISIPNNATNGDVIQAMFPEINKYFSNVIEWRLWWNAPYQKGDKK